MEKIYEITVYTNEAAFTYNVIPTTDNFEDDLLSAIGSGIVMIDTVEGSKLILNTANIMAVEVKEVIAT